MIFKGADRRFEVFKLVNGVSYKANCDKGPSESFRRRQGPGKLKDMELIREKKDGRGNVVKKAGSVVYEKNPIVKHIPVAYFEGVADTSKLVKKALQKQARISKLDLYMCPRRKRFSIFSDWERTNLTNSRGRA